MSTTTRSGLVEKAQSRVSRGGSRPSSPRDVEPPRQRRPALAALAVLLIVGGALVAGLFAVRMDSRTQVLVAARDITPGSVVTAQDFTKVSVSADGVPVIPASAVGQVLDGATYANVLIRKGSLVDQNMLTRKAVFTDGRSIVSVGLDPKRSPVATLRAGDLVQVLRTSAQSTGKVVPLTQALVLSVSQAKAGDFGSGGSSGSAVLLVPTEAASDVVDASANEQAGLALVDRGQPTDVELQVSK